MEILDEYFKSNRYFLTKHHLDSYNDFISHKLIKTIQVLNPFKVYKEQDSLTHDIQVFIGNESGEEIFINKPTIFENTQRPLYPNEARLRNMTYASDLYANVLVRYITNSGGKESIEDKLFKNIKFGNIPIMLHSKLCVCADQPKEILKEMGECPYDQGGYFIINGKEKVIVAQERIATNMIFISGDKILIRCTSEDAPLFPKTIRFVIQDNTPDPINYLSLQKIKNAILIESPNIAKNVPIFILFRALGIESDKTILEYIDLPESEWEYLRPSIQQACFIKDQHSALEYLSNFTKFKDISEIKKILLQDIFPNMGNSFRNKALFLGYLIKQIVLVKIGARKETDRDSYRYKRVDISGFMISNLFRDYYNQFRNFIRNTIDREYLYGPWRTSKNISALIHSANIHTIFKPDIIQNGILKSLKGNWGTNMIQEQQDLDKIKQGIVQDLSRISYLGTISHLRRVNTPLDATAKIIEPHRLHTSQWGIMCPCESPDGGSIGLLKNMAILAHITFDMPTQPWQDFVLKNKCIKLESATPTQLKYTKVLINNSWFGVIKDPIILFNSLKKEKLDNSIFTSISWDVLRSQIHILTESGRCCRPLLIINDGKYPDTVGKNWKQLLDSCIEFVDIEEANTSLIAMEPESITKYHTHCEIHPSTIFSVLTHNIPLCNHNQAPRNIFSGAQGKQAIGIYATNFNNRIDTMSYILHYPQKALVNTRYKEYQNNNILPNGENLIVAISTYSGYNIDDAIIFNKDSIMRGCFNITYYKSHESKEELSEEASITYANPVNANAINTKFANYTKLDENGFPKINAQIKEYDVFLGKVKKEYKKVLKETDIFDTHHKEEIISDRSTVADKTISGTIDKVFVYLDDAGVKNCKLRFRKIRSPEFGDKLCSTHAQKGVIGMLMRAEDMPFTKDGIIPDIIVNPHAMPSRMTIAHLLECLLGKIACVEGHCIDATPFNNYDYKLEGFTKYGNEIMYNGHTGYQQKTDIFIGPIYYERLKHMVADKINYRSTGFKVAEDEFNKQIIKTAPVESITRQPTKGRGNNGGLRIGEMERDSLIAHGGMAFLKESLLERSDDFKFYIDKQKVHAPFAFKQLLQELETLNIKVVLSNEDKPEIYDDDRVDEYDYGEEQE